MAADFSERHEEVLATLRAMIDKNGHPPTTRELAAELGIAPSMVHRYLIRFRSLGRVRWVEGRARTLTVVDDAEAGTA